MKKLILLILCANFVFAAQLNFKDVTLDEFELYGVSKKIGFKSKEQRDMLIVNLWEEFFNSKAFRNAKNDDKVIVVYSNYQRNTFDCFIGLKTEAKIPGVRAMLIPKTNFNKTTITYTKSLDLDKLWSDINKIRIKRDFKMDMEEYLISDLMKPSYKFNIYLSKK